jgi:hypothetical protein
MKIPKKFIYLILILILTISALPLLAQDNAVNFETRVVESFDNPTPRRWAVQSSDFLVAGSLDYAFIKAWPEALFGKNKEEADLRVLAITAEFDRPGYNYLEIIPVEEGSDGTLVAKPLELPGTVQHLDVWVWGSNHNQYLEAHLLDSNDIIHVLQLGELNFLGWKNLRVTIPSSIPQSKPTPPRSRPLQLIKLVLWTRPAEKPTTFYVFFDQMRILTNTFVARFDGDEFEDEDYLNQLWDEASASE